MQDRECELNVMRLTKPGFEIRAGRPPPLSAPRCSPENAGAPAPTPKTAYLERSSEGGAIKQDCPIAQHTAFARPQQPASPRMARHPTK